jgi:signal transduction histidine kinase
LDIKWKKYSHSRISKFIAFMLALLCFTSALTLCANVILFKDVNFGISFEKNYYLSSKFMSESNLILSDLSAITKTYKNEEYILSGKTLSQDELNRREERLFWDFTNRSKSYNPNLTDQENRQLFKEAYANEIKQLKNQLIAEDLQAYQSTLRRLSQHPGLMYYAKSGDIEFTNSPNPGKDSFKTSPFYMIFDRSEQIVSPLEIKDNPDYRWVNQTINTLGPQDKIYITFGEDYLNPKIQEWEKNKIEVTHALYQITGLLFGLALAFIYLVMVTGRKPEDNQAISSNFIDRIFNDFKIALCLALIVLWAGSMALFNDSKIYQLIFPITLVIAAFGLILVLSLVKQIKNKTLLRYTLIFTLFHKLFQFIKNVYDSGRVGVKVTLIVIGYPLLVALTFFMFPITLGLAAWLALKKVKEFEAIKQGVKKVKDGDIHHTINVTGKGEFGQLASDINHLTDGLNKAVATELKSERLKTELITNVSHDIRTPLTSIITYVDLLKTEKNPQKSEEYLAIIDQKSQRLKSLTEDLFDAAKASSGNLPVNLEKIDLVALLTQGLGELDDKIQDRKLDIRLRYPQEKLWIQADGKLLWRAIENLLSNILKYALEGSRVYIEVTDSGTGVTLTLKNISAYELNISSTELIERFVRGDESRGSQGSGLGLSITKSLIELQKGRFNVEIDGDLFKATLQMNK